MVIKIRKRGYYYKWIAPKESHCHSSWEMAIHGGNQWTPKKQKKKIRKAMKLRWFTRKLKLNEQPLKTQARKVTFGESLDKTIIQKDWHFLTNGSQVKTGLGIKWKFLLYFIYLLWALHCRYLCVLLWTGCLRNAWWWWWWWWQWQSVCF